MTNIRKIGKVKIVDNNLVYKQEKNLIDIYNYLLSRDFKNFPELVKRENEKNIYKYVEDFSLDNNQLGIDIINIMSNLHNKTSYSKEIKQDTYTKIVESLDGYINYLNNYYEDILNKYEEIEIPSPSELLYMTNYKKINEVLIFLKEEIKQYNSLIINKNKARVSLIHGNINLNHIIVNKEKYLISWDQARFDSPIIDFINFYKNDWELLDFTEPLKIYLEKVKLSEDELKLLFINICIPDKIEIKGTELEKVNITRKLFDYIYKCEELIRPYYSIENKK